MFQFAYDCGSLCFHNLLFSQGASELVAHLTICRGIRAHLSSTDQGLIAVHDPWMGNGVVGLCRLLGKDSHAVQPSAATMEEQQTLERFTADASAILRSVADELPTTPQDVLDRFQEG